MYVSYMSGIFDFTGKKRAVKEWRKEVMWMISDAGENISTSLDSQLKYMVWKVELFMASHCR